MNISWLANQLPACNQKSEVVDPHEWYKNLALAIGWVIGVLVVSTTHPSSFAPPSPTHHPTRYDPLIIHSQVINWAVLGRQAWERFGGNAHRTEQLLQEMASYPEKRRANINNWNKVFPYTLARSASSASSAASAAATDEPNRRDGVFGGSFTNKRASLHNGIKHYATNGSTGGGTQCMGIGIV